MSEARPVDAPIEPVQVVEALLFASDTPVEADRLQDVLGLGSAAEARALVEEFGQSLERDGRGLQVVEVGGGFRLVTRPELAPWLVKLARSRTRSRLSRPALETLAIVAYRQPVSRPEVDAIRGVNSEGVLENLLERRMLRIAGRKDSPGRPFLYETTREFLVAFGLRDLAELPKAEGELIVPGTAAPGDAQPELMTTAEADAPPQVASEAREVSARDDPVGGQLGEAQPEASRADTEGGPSGSRPGEPQPPGEASGNDRRAEGERGAADAPPPGQTE